MKSLFSFSFAAALCCCLLSAACRQVGPSSGSRGQRTFREGFESGSKRAYASGNVSLGSGDWLLDGALIGSADADFKTGAASLRISPGGYADMLFDLDAVPDTLSFYFAAYGKDQDASVTLWYSNDGGRRWEKLAGPFQHSGDGSGIAEIAPERGYRAPIRFRLRNEGNGRANIDDFGAGGLSPAPRSNAAPRHGRADAASDAPSASDAHLLLGNPSGAAADPAAKTNYLLRRPQYTLSYNSERGTANWVSWHLSLAEQGNAPRCNCFAADAALPERFFRAQSSNYIGSGFDRGHICASDDRSGSPEDNAATFLMTNIAPQAPDLNQKCWRMLEEYARRLTESGKELYVISGCYGAGGEGSKGRAQTIAGGRITVPAHFWKIILVLPDGNDDRSRIDAQTEVIAVSMPNTQSAGRYDWQSFRCTVASIEKATGYRFFSALPAGVAEALRRK